MIPILITNVPATSKNVDPLGSTVQFFFNGTIQLDTKKEYEIGLYNFSVVYNQPNCVGLTLDFDYKSIAYSIPFPNGLYSLGDINNTLTLLTNGLYPKGLFYVEGLESTGQCALTCYDPSNTGVLFTSTSIFTNVLGFNVTTSKFSPTSTTAYSLSTNRCTLNNISNFYISVDVSTGFYNNSNNSNLIYCTPITANPNSTQSAEPRNVIWCKVWKYSMDSITVKITGDNNLPLDLTGGLGVNPELFTALVIIREKK